jgi:hypothetical protein
VSSLLYRGGKDALGAPGTAFASDEQLGDLTALGRQSHRFAAKGQFEHSAGGLREPAPRVRTTVDTSGWRFWTADQIRFKASTCSPLNLTLGVE